MFDLPSLAMFGMNVAQDIYQQRQNQQNFNRQLHEQERFAQNGIQWRVNDAVAAGLHPLFALGSPGASFSPMPIQVGSNGGIAQGMQDLIDGYEPTDDVGGTVDSKGVHVVGRTKSLAQIRRENNRTLAVRQRKLMKAEDDLIQLQVDTAREQLNQLRQQRDKGASLMGVDDADKAKLKPWVNKTNEVAFSSPGKPHITAGPDTPAWTRYRIRPNLALIAPGGASFSEALESLEGTTPKLFVIAANMAEFGPTWLDQVAKELNWSSAKKKMVYDQVVPFLVP